MSVECSDWVLAMYSVMVLSVKRFLSKRKHERKMLVRYAIVERMDMDTIIQYTIHSTFYTQYIVHTTYRNSMRSIVAVRNILLS